MTCSTDCACAMCRRVDSLIRSSALTALLALGCLALGGRGLSAQTSESFPLEPSTRQELAELQESWIDWLAAINRGELELAATTVVELDEKSESLGMSGLPDLASAAAIQAVAFAGDSDFAKAEAALEAAELLQAGEPEVALAAMTVAWKQGRWVAAGSWLGRGVARVFRAPLSRKVVLANLIQWLLVVLTLAAFSFVGVEMATRGGLLVRDLSGFIGHSLPPVAAVALTALLLLWPVVFPAGLLWLGLYWSVLLWGYGTRVVRVVMIALWFFMGGLPLLVSEHVRRVDLGLSTPVRAMENVMAGRMPGALFSDFGVLVDLLPESIAVKHLQADLHLQLKQWEMARSLYLEVLDAEGGRAPRRARYTIPHIGWVRQGARPGDANVKASVDRRRSAATRGARLDPPVSPRAQRSCNRRGRGVCCLVG